MGRAGELLATALTQAGIDESELYLTNAMSCRPKESPPPRQAIDACALRLIEELSLLPEAKVFVLMGNSAMRSLTGDHKLKITTERGKVIDWAGKPMVPTFHPALVLRNPHEMPKLVADLRYAKTLLEGAEPKSPGECEFQVLNARTIGPALERLSSASVDLGCDVEADGYNPRTTKILCLGIAFAKNKVLTIPEELMEHPAVATFLASPAPRFVWQNGKSDIAWLRAAGLTARVDEDTMLMHYAMNSTRGIHGLEVMASDYLGAPDYKSAMKRDYPAAKESFRNVPPGVLRLYNAKDCDNTRQLYYLFRKQLDADPNALKLYRRLLLPASRFLERVEERGLWVDQAYLAQLETELTYERDAAVDQLMSVTQHLWDAQAYARDTGAKKVPKYFNPGSPRQVTWVLLQDYHRVTSTARAVLEKLPPTPFTEGLLAMRKAGKALDSFVEGIRSRIDPTDGRVHSSFLLHGTETGRLSSRGPNLQNIPAEARIRNMFSAQPGNALVELDYSQAELRLLAHFSGDRFLLGVYREGRNLHDEVAKRLFGERYSYQQKMRAKAVNFGIAYGRSADSLATEFDIPMHEAQRWIDEWWTNAPDAQAFLQRCREMARKGTTVVNPFGRRRKFGLVNEDNLRSLQNEAANFPMQSTASDITLVSAMRIEAYLKTNGVLAAGRGRSRSGFRGDSLSGIGVRGIVNLVHDSILIECTQEEVHEVSRAAGRIMQQTAMEVLKAEIPFPVDVHVGTCWGDVSGK